MHAANEPLLSSLIDLIDSEMEGVTIPPRKLSVIPIVWLREYHNNRGLHAERELEFCVEVVYRPGDVAAGPALRYVPVWGEEPHAVDGTVLFEKVVIGHPEDAVVTEAVFELCHELGCPFLAAIAPVASPFAFAPRVADCGEMSAIDQRRQRS